MGTAETRLDAALYILLLLLLVGHCAWATGWPAVAGPALAAVLLVAVALIWRWGKRDQEQHERRRAELLAVAAPEGLAWRRLLAHQGHAAWVEKLAPEARWALRVEATEQDVRSRLGGEPLLPAGFSWPTHAGKPLGFLGQLDLREASAALPAWPGPKDGVLSFFGSEALWTAERSEDAASARVVHHVGELGPAQVPGDVPTAWRFPERRVAFVAYEDPPPELVPSHEEAAFEAVAEIRGLLGSGTTGATRLLGHADVIQHPMEEICELVARGLPETTPLDDARGREIKQAAKKWRLLLQLDEGAPGMSWGDAGLLYLWIREEDLVAGRFDRVWPILQHH